VGPRCQREEREERRSGWGKRKWAGLAHAGEEERKRRWAGLREGNWAAFSFLFLSYTQTNSLNSNRFEFKHYKLNTRKIMLQHECTSKLTL
jgi:hypothetical protein